MNRRASIIALLLGSCGLIVKAHQDQATYRSTTAIRVEEFDTAWRHWRVTVPATLTVEDPESKTTITLTSADILDALRGGGR